MKKLTLLLALGVAGANAYALDLRVSITNLAPQNGTFLTPLWFGLHDGTFDQLNIGSAASAGIERIAEDGNASVLGSEFMASGAGSVSGVLNGVGPIAPMVTTSQIISVTASDPRARYFSYASMVIPSNDAFIANDNAREVSLFNENGVFIGADFVVLGSRVLDAGTEVNDEIPANTAFLGQSAPNTGVNENGVIHFHPGFLTGGNILSDPRFANGDFTAADYQVARIRVEAVPEPATLAVLGAGALALLRRRKRA